MSLLRGCLAASWFVSVCLSPTFSTLARVPCGMQGWCCAGGNRAHQLAKRQVMMVVAAMRGCAGWASRREVGRSERRGEREEGRRQEGRKPKKVGWHQRAGVWGLGDGLQSLGLHQLLSGGGSLCTLFFFILSKYSCWDTASTDARISSSSQSFRPAGQEEGKKDDRAL